MSRRPGPGLGLAMVAGLAGLCLQVGAAQHPCEPPTNRFVTTRPRLFINAESLPSVTRYAARTHGDVLDNMRKHVGALAAATNLPPGDYGVPAAAAAFLFLCERTPTRLGVATGLLERSVAHFRRRDRERRTVDHYSATRIHAIVAYDWLYDDMSAEQRARLGRDLIAHVAHRVLDRAVPGDNLSDYRSGFYGELSLPWYVGIATRGTGIDEEKSAAAITFGYEQHMRMLEHRRRLAGDDGGDATATLGYALRADPWAEFNFFHTVKSAFGLDIAGDWPHLAQLPQYVLWNCLPGNLEFGAGDAFHLSNALPDEHLHTHLAQIRHFFGQSHPEQAALAAWMQGQCRRPSYHPAWPLTPFLLAALDRAPPPREPVWDSLPRARHFAGMGQFFMRSGWGADDTYALFTAGGRHDWHKHFDENTFVLFHRGFLALDSGTRPEPGSHLFQYYCRTVAHNGILIRMEGETLPPYWGVPAPGEPALPVANDGGMRSVTGAVVRGFRATRDYTYIASDATACYHPAKCTLATRQFLHVQPDVFVVFDRVSSVKPTYRKTWLLHTAREPRFIGPVVTADQGGGRLFCRTLWPTNAVLSVIGGPGREFWSDGRNWPLPQVAEGEAGLAQTELMGTWRLEVTPAIPAQDDTFLHLIEVGDLAKTHMTPVRLLREDRWTGVEFTAGGASWMARFSTLGDLGAEIGMLHGTNRVITALDNTIQPAAGPASGGPSASDNPHPAVGDARAP